MVKRGYKNILIIIWIILFLFLIILYYNEILSFFHINSVNLSKESCYNSEFLKAIEYVSYSGGYFSTLKTESDDIAFYISNGNIIVPSRIEIEEAIRRYLKNSLYSCNKDIKNIDVKIYDEYVILNIDNSKITQNARIGVVNYFSLEIINDIIEKKEICASCIDLLLDKYDLFLNINKIDDDIYIFAIEDKKSLIKNGGLKFYFKVDLRGLE